MIYIHRTLWTGGPQRPYISVRRVVILCAIASDGASASYALLTAGACVAQCPTFVLRDSLAAGDESLRVDDGDDRKRRTWRCSACSNAGIQCIANP
jgi:DNA-binding transcriptional LysR family regulator